MSAHELIHDFGDQNNVACEVARVHTTVSKTLGDDDDNYDVYVYNDDDYVAAADDDDHHDPDEPIQIHALPTLKKKVNL